MARRKSSKKTTKRSRRPAFNLVNAAQSYAQTAIITRAAFNTNPVEFLTGQQFMAATSGTNTVEFGSTGYTYEQAYTTPASFGYSPIGNGTALTLPELLGFDSSERPTGVVKFGSGGMEAIRANIALNGGLFKPVMQTIGLNLGFAIGKKVFSKQRTMLNRGAKMSGFGTMIKF